MWRNDNAIDFNQFGDIRKLLGTEEFSAPQLDFKKMTGELAVCSWYKYANLVNIDINDQLLRLKDNSIINRCLAHELCHEAEYRLFWYPQLAVLAKEFATSKNEEVAKQGYEEFNNLMDKTSHGPQWQKYADMVNAIYGPNYVTKTSDKSYDLTFADRKWYQIWKKRTL